MRSLMARLSVLLVLSLLLGCVSPAAMAANEYPSFEAQILTFMQSDINASDWNGSSRTRAIYACITVMDFGFGVDGSISDQWDYTNTPAFFGMHTGWPSMAVCMGGDYYVTAHWEHDGKVELMYTVIKDAKPSQIEASMRQNCDEFYQLDPAEIEQVMAEYYAMLGE